MSVCFVLTRDCHSCRHQTQVDELRKDIDKADNVSGQMLEGIPALRVLGTECCAILQESAPGEVLAQ